MKEKKDFFMRKNNYVINDIIGRIFNTINNSHRKVQSRGTQKCMRKKIKMYLGKIRIFPFFFTNRRKNFFLLHKYKEIQKNIYFFQSRNPSNEVQQK